MGAYNCFMYFEDKIERLGTDKAVGKIFRQRRRVRKISNNSGSFILWNCMKNFKGCYFSAGKFFTVNGFSNFQYPAFYKMRVLLQKKFNISAVYRGATLDTEKSADGFGRF